MSTLTPIVERYGGDPAALVSFLGEETPAQLPYATLTGQHRSDSASDIAALAGAYEWQNNPLMFLVDGDMIAGHRDRLARIRRRIALRGDAPYLGVIESGRLTVHHVALDRSSIARTRVALPQADGVVMPFLANERPGAALARNRWISELILRLLRDALKQLVDAGLDGADAISLAGRALFARFLCDRELMPSGTPELGALDGLFDDSQQAARTCGWLDRTFNGDFLP